MTLGKDCIFDSEYNNRPLLVKLFFLQIRQHKVIVGDPHYGQLKVHVVDLIRLG